MFGPAIGGPVSVYGDFIAPVMMAAMPGSPNFVVLAPSRQRSTPMLTLHHARIIIAEALKKGANEGFKPLTVCVLDAGGALIALERSDGSSKMRPDIAIGKANGALSLGIGSRAIHKRAEEQPMNALAKGSLVPVPGGVLVKGEGGAILGAVGITGDTSDNDEIAAIAGIEAAGFAADGG